MWLGGSNVFGFYETRGRFVRDARATKRARQCTVQVKHILNNPSLFKTKKHCLHLDQRPNTRWLLKDS